MKTESKDAIQVSVFCLAYNHEKYIRKTLEGFVNQETDFQFEVLIHDDASTDGTAAIIAEYEEKYPELIKPIYQTENQYSKGVKINQTYNYPRAKGKYCAWCEGDDYWCDKQKLQKQFDAMEAHPECSFCAHKVQCINEDGSINKRVIPEKYYGFDYEGILSESMVADALWKKGSCYPFQTSCFFARRDSFQEMIDGKLNYAGYTGGDQVIVRTALKNGHIYYINQTMSHYRWLSIGSYNANKAKLSEGERREILLKKAKCDLLFDESTAGRFHKWIIRSVSDRVVLDSAFQPERMDEFLNYLDVRKEDVLSHCSTKTKMIYYLSVYAHPIYLFLKKARSGLRRA